MSKNQIPYQTLAGIYRYPIGQRVLKHLRNYHNVAIDHPAKLDIAMARAAHFPYSIIILEHQNTEAFLQCLAITRRKNKSALIIIIDTDDNRQLQSLLERGADFVLACRGNYEFLLRQLDILIEKFAPNEQELICLKNLTLNRKLYEASIKRKKIFLQRREFLLLAYLASHPDTILSREQIVRQVWGGKKIKRNTIDCHINRLRIKLGEKAGKIIRTIHSRGYILVNSSL